MEIETKEIKEKPPFFKSWKTVYLIVLGIEVVLIILFYIISSLY